MSSFIISKIEYVKAAGLLYGIERSKGRNAHTWYLEHLQGWFEDLYRWNVKSVCEQYGDEETYDEGTYDKIFSVYADKGHMACNGFVNGVTRESLRDGLQQFFDSVLYQIEDEELNDRAAAIFYRCVKQISPRHTEGWWGEIEI